MNVFEAVVFVMGYVVIVVLGIFLLTILLYAMSALIAFVFLCVRLNVKGISKTIIQTHSTFDDKGNYTNYRINTGWPAQYIKYVVGNYFQIVWVNGWVSKVLNCLANSKYSSRNNDSQKDISDFTPIPFNDKSPDSVHTDNLPKENDDVNHKQTEPKLALKRERHGKRMRWFYSVGGARSSGRRSAASSR